MKTLIMISGLLIAFLPAFAQNSVTIKFSDQSVSASAATLDANAPLYVSFVDCNALKNKKATYQAEQHGVVIEKRTTDCNSPILLDLKKTFDKDAADILVTVTGIKNDKAGSPFNVSFSLDKNGKLSGDGITQQSSQELVALPEDKTVFVNPEFLTGSYTTPNTDCYYPRVEYNLCCPAPFFNVYNTAAEKEAKNPQNYIRYNNFRENQAVHFFITNFNTAKYDITVGSDYENTTSAVPDLYNTLFTLLGPAGGKESLDQPDEIQSEFAKIINLNKQLKDFLKSLLTDADCTDNDILEQRKKSILDAIANAFDKKKPALSFDEKYTALKTKRITNHKKNPDGTDYKNPDFNKDIKTLYHLSTTPDSIIAETKTLIQRMGSTTFTYHYIVPQLQNADFINFTLSVKPKDGSEGTKHIDNKPISIPLRGGWKVDFSTGFYYSNIKNYSYGLKNHVENDTIRYKEIIGEDGKNNGKNALGLTALVHIYKRLGFWQPAFTFGLGGSTDLNYSFLVGPSLVCGKRNKVILSAGANFSSIKVLSDKYYDNGSLAQVRPDVTTIDTRNKIKSGWFVGLTYSFSFMSSTQSAASSGDKDKGDDSKK
ncbi:MAG: hypothetical protein AAGC65_12560 [Mucilaginibacter sp.]|uniref:hypothetical protein n=1 Tax=Mucilaginibacter sp. TaxID=1882438 RepID=UPI0031A90944